MAASNKKATKEINASIRRLRTSLERLEAAAEENVRRAEMIQERIRHLDAELAAGRPLSDVVLEEERPLIVELITRNIEALQQTGRALRRAEAEALQAHGWTATRIAELFGVSRQRISELLRS